MNAIRQYIRDHRRAILFSGPALLAEKYLRAWYNEDFYDFSKNGEAFALTKFGTWWGSRSINIWDIGAHRGDWSMIAHKLVPQAHITSFEMIPAVYEQMVAKLSPSDWSTPVCCALSESEGRQTAFWNQKYDTTSSIQPRSGHVFADKSDLVEINCSSTTADIYSRSNGSPNMLKIDTEGHEISVLRGCRDVLTGGMPPDMIQFEYGSTYLPGGFTLKNAYDILVPQGYSVGRLYPNHVDFREYEYKDDNFRMGNFIAVRSEELKRMLL
jgi:FkbM family methyltransferase